MALKKKQAEKPSRKADPTKTKAFKKAVSSEKAETRKKVSGEWEQKLKAQAAKTKAALLANKDTIIEVAVHKVLVPSALGTAFNLGADYAIAKTPLKEYPYLAKVARVATGTVLTVAAHLVKPTRRYAPAFAASALTVTGVDLGREMLAKQLKGGAGFENKYLTEDAAANNQLMGPQSLALNYEQEEIWENLASNALSGANDKAMIAGGNADFIGQDNEPVRNTNFL